MNTISCTLCGWQGRDSDLVPVKVPNPTDPYDVVTEAGCPECKCFWWLEEQNDNKDN